MREPVVRVVMMQRNEGALLLAWLTHYAQLFGMDRLTILDNGSTDNLTLYLLRHAANMGATVRTDLNDIADFHGKGFHMATTMQAWDEGEDYDFALPVDCDEFLAVVGDDRISGGRADIMREFVRLRDCRTALRIDLSLFNVPEQPGWFAVDPEFHKGFLPAGGVDTVDNGQHNPNSRLAPGVTTSRFAYLHWHNRPFEEMRAAARRKLTTSLVDPDDPAALEHYRRVPNLPGRHLLPILTMDEETYRQRYDRTLRLFLPWARHPAGSMAAPRGDEPFCLADGRGVFGWDAANYLAGNADVRAYDIGPLHHFLRYGWAEGRSLGGDGSGEES